jgi:hypothetical protein
MNSIKFFNLNVLESALYIFMQLHLNILSIFHHVIANRGVIIGLINLDNLYCYLPYVNFDTY